VRVEKTVADADLLKPFQLAREKYKAHKKQLGNRQADTMARLAKFQALLRGGAGSSGGGGPPAAEAAAAEVAATPAAGKTDVAAALAAAAAGAAAAAAAAAAGAAQGGGGGGGGEGGKGGVGDEVAYDGKVRKDLDHRAYMPAAWRVDDYLNQEDKDEDDFASLRQHK
jgi:peptidyl-prolyl cis-trans isomerase SDCCAG10